MIGAGVAGLVAARRAAVDGARVALLADPDRPAASAVAAGMIAPAGEATWGEERLLAAARAAAAAWPGFASSLEREAGTPVPYRRRGSLQIALDRDEAGELRRRAELHGRLGLEHEALLGSECRRREPGLGTAVSAGIALDGEAEVDPRALLAALTAACERAGAERIAGRVAEIEPASGLIRCRSGRQVRAGRVVLAAGAWSGQGLLGSAVTLPVRPVKGEILRLRADGRPPCERIIVGERFYVVPRDSGEVVVGATVEEKGFDLRVTAGGVHELLREAYRALPELAELELVEASAGLRPGSPDNAPIVGAIGEAGVIVLTGLHRNGILLAPLLDGAAAALLGEGPLPPELAGLGPERFSTAEAPA